MASASFYHYQNAEGVEVIVQRFDDVPVMYRAAVKKVDLDAALPKNVQIEIPAAPSPLAPGKEFWRAIHWPSFVVGAVISLGTGLVFVLLLRRRSRILSVLVGALAMMAFAVGYLTFLRHQAGLRSTGLATPATVLDDAREAAATAQKRYDQQEKTLDQINNMR